MPQKLIWMSAPFVMGRQVGFDSPLRLWGEAQPVVHPPLERKAVGSSPTSPATARHSRPTRGIPEVPTVGAVHRLESGKGPVVVRESSILSASSHGTCPAASHHRTERARTARPLLATKGRPVQPGPIV